MIRILESFFDLLRAGSEVIFQSKGQEIGSLKVVKFGLKWFLVSMIWTLGGDMFVAQRNEYFKECLDNYRRL